MSNRKIRIPNLPLGKWVDDDGAPTPEYLTFLQTVISSLQIYFGDEGCVFPTQNSDNITVIQNNQLPNGEYSCQYGTGLYDETNNEIKFAVDDGSGAPIFKTVTLT